VKSTKKDATSPPDVLSRKREGEVKKKKKRTEGEVDRDPRTTYRRYLVISEGRRQNACGEKCSKAQLPHSVLRIEGSGMQQGNRKNGKFLEVKKQLTKGRPPHDQSQSKMVLQSSRNTAPEETGLKTTTTDLAIGEAQKGQRILKMYFVLYLKIHTRRAGTKSALKESGNLKKIRWLEKRSGMDRGKRESACPSSSKRGHRKGATYKESLA